MKNKLAGLLILLSLSPVMLLAQGAGWEGCWGNRMGFMGRGWGGHMGFMGGGFMMIIWILLLVFIIIAVLKWIFPAKFNSGATASALSILSERYAKGEISEEEFQTMKKALR